MVWEFVQILFDCAAKLYMDINVLFNEQYAKWTITDKANSMLRGASFDALAAEETTRAKAITKKWSAKNDARVDSQKN